MQIGGRSVHVTAVRQTVRRRARHSQAGFNLVELLVVIGLASLLMGLGVSSYRYITNSSRVSSEINSLLGDMQMARSEAIKRGQIVSVCPANSDGTACAGGAGSWNNGWIVFTDWNGDGAVTAGAPDNDQVVRIQPKWTSTDAVTTNNAGVNSVRFNRNGLATNIPFNGTTDYVLTLNTSPANVTWQRCLDITSTGGMQTERKGDVSGNCP
jgi:type IV fimbrial biogenesis protein FimT